MKMFFAAILTVIFGASVVYDVATWRDFVGFAEEMKIEWMGETKSVPVAKASTTVRVSTEPIEKRLYNEMCLKGGNPQYSKEHNDRECRKMIEDMIFFNRASLKSGLIVASRLRIDFDQNPYARNNIMLLGEYAQTCEKVINIINFLKDTTLIEEVSKHKLHRNTCDGS